MADGVNVGNEIYVIDTERTRHGGRLRADQQIEKQRTPDAPEALDGTRTRDTTYAANQLDRSVVNPRPDPHRRRRLPGQAAGDISRTARKSRRRWSSPRPTATPTMSSRPCARSSARATSFARRSSYKVDEDPRSVLAQFRNDYYPRVAVTVDMIATGTDVKPLECLLFMRDVRSRNYFEQMKGRGTQYPSATTISGRSRRSALTAKTHYVIVDAVGVTKSLKTGSRPLITKPSVPLKDPCHGA